MYRDPKAARAAVKAAKAQAKLHVRAANARAADAILIARGWADALAPVMAAIPRTVSRNVNAWAEASDKALASGANLMDASAAGEDIADMVPLAQEANLCLAVRDSAREDVKALGKDEALTPSVVAASIAAGMVSPRALRRQLGSAMLCADMAHEVATAKAELTAALDAQVQAVAALKAAK